MDFTHRINQHPDTAAVNAALKTEQEAAKQKFDSKAAGLSNTYQQNFARQLNHRVEQKRQELLWPIAANKAAREKACLSSVVKTRSSAAAYTLPPMFF